MRLVTAAALAAARAQFLGIAGKEQCMSAMRGADAYLGRRLGELLPEDAIITVGARRHLL